MSDQVKSNLEPIDESDVNLKEKFLGDGEKSAGHPEMPSEARNKKKETVPVHSIEGAVERREGTAEKEAAYSKILSKIGSHVHLATTGDEDVESDAQNVGAAADAETKIQNLVKLSEVKGIPHAVKVARHMEDNYTLDEFHDRLLGEELHAALVAKGMIKEL